jgi:Domain of unknown function (DUF4389)
MASSAAYPVSVEARLDPRLSRWLWLVKWLLAVPHYVVLFFLWIAFGVLSVVAFFAILITGSYPRSIFEFNVGVLRWSWRVAYYAYGALGTDRYPPFTLAEVPDYPTHLEIAYPERLSRGLVLVKWWLLAIPHYLIVGLLLGGGTSVAWSDDNGAWSTGGAGLITLLVAIAAVILTFTGRYPTGLFDLVLGLNRWVLRVAAYVGLMTDAYPPFRLDLGGSEPGGTLTVPPAPPGGKAGAAGSGTPTGVSRSAEPWTAGRVVALAIGVLLALTAAGLFTGSGLALWADRTQRDAAGYLTTDTQRFSTGAYALATEDIDLRVDGPDWLYPTATLDTVRIRASGADPATPVFVGIARSGDAAAYLAGIGHDTVTGLGDGSAYRSHAGGAPEAAPAQQPFWTASSVGAGTSTLVWPVREGSWTVVAMNADGSRGVDVRADLGAKVPALAWIATGLLVGGLVLLAGGAALLVVAVRRPGRAS